ncbi:phosphoglycolate phosphatase [Jatrophihabitans sp. GAS493]|uniref:HAD hydrolase-like protein n=1 Tax=Jatrophihabitans sp. GAS493 TaxID=1907575 RepID=UPI000BC0B20F|nr:HAD hydrolase-like protein [Jatrophihabitans sp. GAS493]SOD73357.1 phosphoglycolate phosphatase [Jatrophihabitans sp. GAS493]
MTLQTVLFDLDGTVSDSAPGILSSLSWAFAENGIAPLDERTGRALLGPPFYESLPPLIGGDLVPAVIASYREHYATAMFDTELYAGMGEVLRQLVDRGVTLALATSKPEHYAGPILEHLGVADLFAVIGGDTLDGARNTKALVVAEVVSRLQLEDPASALMVGDRLHDVHGSAVHGIACLGAGWGYGLEGELELAGARQIFATPADLGAYLASLELPGPGESGGG